MLKNMEIEQLSVALGHRLQYLELELEDGKGMEFSTWRLEPNKTNEYI